MSEVKPLTLSPGKAGKVLGIGRTKVMDLVRSGHLSAVVLDKRIRISTQSIDALLASLPTYIPGQMSDLHPRTPLPKKRREVA